MRQSGSVVAGCIQFEQVCNLLHCGGRVSGSTGFGCLTRRSPPGQIGNSLLVCARREHRSPEGGSFHRRGWSCSLPWIAQASQHGERILRSGRSCPQQIQEWTLNNARDRHSSTPRFLRISGPDRPLRPALAPGSGIPLPHAAICCDVFEFAVSNFKTVWFSGNLCAPPLTGRESWIARDNLVSAPVAEFG